MGSTGAAAGGFAQGLAAGFTGTFQGGTKLRDILAIENLKARRAAAELSGERLNISRERLSLARQGREAAQQKAINDATKNGVALIGKALDQAPGDIRKFLASKGLDMMRLEGKEKADALALLSNIEPAQRKAFESGIRKLQEANPNVDTAATFRQALVDPGSFFKRVAEAEKVITARNRVTNILEQAQNEAGEAENPIAVMTRARDIALQAGFATEAKLFDDQVNNLNTQAKARKEAAVPPGGFTDHGKAAFDNANLLRVPEASRSEDHKALITANRRVIESTGRPKLVEEAAFAKTMGKANAEQLISLKAKANKALDERVARVEFRAGLEGFETGALGNARAWATRLAGFFGIEPGSIPVLGATGVGSVDLLERATGTFVIAAAQRYNDRLNGKEFALVTSAAKNLLKSKEGNLVLADIDEAVGERDAKIGEMVLDAEAEAESSGKPIKVATLMKAINAERRKPVITPQLRQAMTNLSKVAELPRLQDVRATILRDNPNIDKKLLVGIKIEFVGFDDARGSQQGIPNAPWFKFELNNGDTDFYSPFERPQ